MSWYLGLDSSTQSISAVIVDVAAGRLVEDASVSFSELPEFKCPNGFLAGDDPLVRHADPLVWLAGLDRLLQGLVDRGIDLSKVVAVSGSGQQHGTVYLTAGFLKPRAWVWAGDLVGTVRPMLARPTAPIWMDSSTSEECREITAAAGGVAPVQKTTGSPAIERFSGPQIRRFWKRDPDGYRRTAVIHLVSSFMASVLAGRSAPIDLGDGAGMNLLNLGTGAWDPGMINATAPDLAARLPPVVPSHTEVGPIAEYFVRRYGFARGTRVVAWSGDNPNSLIGVGGYAPGTAVISLGTSHTYFAAMRRPTVDPAGYGHVFGNPAGGFMSLICFKNGALAQEEVRRRHQLSWKQFDDCLRRTPPGNAGNMMLPYFVAETTPLVLTPGVVFTGSETFRAGGDADAMVRAVVEAQAYRMRLHSSWIADRTDAVRVTGGASVSREVCQVLADVFNARLERLETENSAGLGAALRAAQATGAGEWQRLTDAFCRPVAGQSVSPLAANVEVYRRQLPAFEAFARQGRGGQSLPHA
ncbi:MAG: Xylulose kinase [Lentisphaerae bacterium ADurb.BinA184]|nr:MAG: Xylulose kinase [Lentisphaerae bacterium ADurb.BinA184]